MRLHDSNALSYGDEEKRGFLRKMTEITGIPVRFKQVDAGTLCTLWPLCVLVATEVSTVHTLTV